ncbi:DUF3616 domain-containing protein [Ramlibacter sp. WS9]|nr:DUF3616 domain-containing protein [Ramlibacter sp. WS9]
MFEPSLEAGERKQLRDGLSTVLQIGNTLWLGNDESASLERLTLTGDSTAGHAQFQLRDFMGLPTPSDQEGTTPEVDVEGMDLADGYLWIVGSHSLKRSKVDSEDPAAAQIKELARTETEANRYVLARIPMQDGSGLPALAAKSKSRPAQRLRSGKDGNALTRLLRKDKHLGPFLGLPGKENGFDVEGLAVVGDRVFLGLRGPVLGGWAVVLEIRPVGEGKWLKLKPLEGSKGVRVRKHFLQLGGLGVRDLCLQGDDLLVLSGPTMSLDGPVREVRWSGAAHCQEACVLEAGALAHVLEVPYGKGCDHAEGIALFRSKGSAKAELLVVYDSPAPRRQVGGNGLVADLFELG